MAEPLRVDLSGPLAGSHLLIDEDALDFGTLEDFESGNIKTTLDALARVIVGGDLPHGTDRDGLRRLSTRRGEVREVFRAVAGATSASDPR